VWTGSGGAAAKLGGERGTKGLGLSRLKKEYCCWSCGRRACARRNLARCKMVGSSVVKNRSRGGFVRSFGQCAFDYLLGPAVAAH
jgi:hypothetical protein